MSLDENEWLASPSGRFISRERVPSITEVPVRHCTVNLQAGKNAGVRQ